MENGIFRRRISKYGSGIHVNRAEINENKNIYSTVLCEARRHDFKIKSGVPKLLRQDLLLLCVPRSSTTARILDQTKTFYVFTRRYRNILLTVNECRNNSYKMCFEYSIALKT